MANAENEIAEDGAEELESPGGDENDEAPDADADTNWSWTNPRSLGGPALMTLFGPRPGWTPSAPILREVDFLAPSEKNGRRPYYVGVCLVCGKAYNARNGVQRTCTRGCSLIWLESPRVNDPSEIARRGEQSLF